VISVIIEPQVGLPTINVQFNDLVSADELREAWRDASSGLLEGHIREAIRCECINRGLDLREVVPDPPTGDN